MRAPGVTVTLAAGGHLVATTTTNSDGRYQFENLDPGSYTVSISSVGEATCPDETAVEVVGIPGDPVPTSVHVSFGCITQPLSFAIRGIIRGRVVVGGEPQSGVVARIPGYLFATTDASGVFRILDVLAGEYELTATLPGHACTRRSVRVFTRLILDAGDLICLPL